MGFEQYHEPADELSAETRTFARMIVSLTEEAEAINWYEQRMSLEKNKSARAIMQDAQKEEFNISRWISSGFCARNRNGARSRRACSSNRATS